MSLSTLSPFALHKKYHYNSHHNPIVINIMSPRPKDPENQGYGTIPSRETSSHLHVTEHTVEESQAEEGPFPVDMKAMFIAEVCGTFVFLQMGLAINNVAIYIDKSNGSILVLVAIVWGLAVTVGMYLAAARSGAHLNPAVSLAFFLVRPADFPWRRLLPYWIAQFCGAIFAALINLFLFYRALGKYEKKHSIDRGTADSIASASAFGDYYNPKYVENRVHAFFIEAFGTSVLVFVIFSLTHRHNPLPGYLVPIFVGTTLTVLVATIGPLTGAGFNPARDIGPRLVSATVGGWGWEVSFYNFLPYLIGPLFGGPIGAFFADKFLFV